MLEIAAPADHETQTSPEDLEILFKDARDAFYDLPFDDDFVDFCRSNNIDPEDTAQPRYWEAAADFADQVSAKAREAGEDERRIAVRELFAATPDYIYQQNIARHNRRDYADQDKYQNAKERVSYYNCLIRYVAEQCPDMQASALTKHLVGIANISVENEHLREASSEAIRTTVRGAQHELAFGQLLAHSGREFRGASTEEDLEGVDYVVVNLDGSIELIDVKASQNTIESRGASNRPYIRGSDGKLTMQSLVTDRELHDRFFVSESLAEQRGVTLGRLLDDISTPGNQVVWAG